MRKTSTRSETEVYDYLWKFIRSLIPGWVNGFRKCNSSAWFPPYQPLLKKIRKQPKNFATVALHNYI